jgi:hypothetical protein
MLVKAIHVHSINLYSLLVILYISGFDIQKFRILPTLHLGYKNQSVNAVLGNNCCLFSNPHKTHTLCGRT